MRTTSLSRTPRDLCLGRRQRPPKSGGGRTGRRSRRAGTTRGRARGAVGCSCAGLNEVAWRSGRCPRASGGLFRHAIPSEKGQVVQGVLRTRVASTKHHFDAVRTTVASSQMQRLVHIAHEMD
jgi:hypothetical protein